MFDHNMGPGGLQGVIPRGDKCLEEPCLNRQGSSTPVEKASSHSFAKPALTGGEHALLWVFNADVLAAFSDDQESW